MAQFEESNHIEYISAAGATISLRLQEGRRGIGQGLRVDCEGEPRIMGGLD